MTGVVRNHIKVLCLAASMMSGETALVKAFPACLAAVGLTEHHSSNHQPDQLYHGLLCYHQGLGKRQALSYAAVT